MFEFNTFLLRLFEVYIVPPFNCHIIPQQLPKGLLSSEVNSQETLSAPLAFVYRIRKFTWTEGTSP